MTHSPIRYLAITTIEGQKFIIRVLGERTHTVGEETFESVFGIEVNKAGDNVEGPDFDERKRIVDKKMIKKAVEMRMSNTYGTLEVL